MTDLPHAQAFLSQLSRVMPPGYRAFIDGDVLFVVSPDGVRTGSGSDWLTAGALMDQEVLESAVQSLHQIQQEIAEETAEPWPARSGRDYRGFPEPDGEIIGDQLRLWFGERDAPVLELALIDLSSVLLRE
jgi:hypothetical protein